MPHFVVVYHFKCIYCKIAVLVRFISDIFCTNRLEQSFHSIFLKSQFCICFGIKVFIDVKKLLFLKHIDLIL